jgi:hypothetical protein
VTMSHCLQGTNCNFGLSHPACEIGHGCIQLTLQPADLIGKRRHLLSQRRHLLSQRRHLLRRYQSSGYGELPADIDSAVKEASKGSTASDESCAMGAYRVNTHTVFALSQYAVTAPSVGAYDSCALIILSEPLRTVMIIADASHPYSGRVDPDNACVVSMFGEPLYSVLEIADAFHPYPGRVDPDNACASNVLTEPLNAVVI